MRMGVRTTIFSGCLWLALGPAQAETVLLDLPQSIERALKTDTRIDEKQKLVEAERVARDVSIDIRLPATEPREMLTCALDPRIMASVRWDGVVAPCIQLNLPISGPIPRMTEAGVTEIPSYLYGHLDDARFSEILAGAARREFTESLHRRCDADGRFRDRGLSAPGWGSVALADLDRDYGELERTLEANPFPRACRGCPKIEGW